MVPLIPIAIALFVIASLFRVAFLYHAFYIVLLVAVLPRLWIARVSSALAVERDLPRRLMFGDPVTIILRIRNTRRLPIPFARIRERLPSALAVGTTFERVVGFGPRQVHEFRIDLLARQRGYFETGPLSIEIGDVLGGVSRRREYESSEHITVVPRLFALEELGLPTRLPIGELSVRRATQGDPSRWSGIRPYESGDSQRLIHWPASARSGSLQVRKLDPTTARPTLIAVDFGASAYDASSSHYASELGLSVAASILVQQSEIGQEVGLIASGRDQARPDRLMADVFEPRKGREHALSLLERLARAELFDGGESLESALLRGRSDLPWGTAIVVVTGRESVELAEALVGCRRGGMSVWICLVTQRSAYSSESSPFDALGFPLSRVWRESDIATQESIAVRGVALAAS